MNDWQMLAACAALGVFGAWTIWRDHKRGRASAAGGGYDKVTQPKRYQATMAFNCFGFVLVLSGAIVQAATLLRHSLSH